MEQIFLLQKSGIIKRFFFIFVMLCASANLYAQAKDGEATVYVGSIVSVGLSDAYRQTLARATNVSYRWYTTDSDISVVTYSKTYAEVKGLRPTTSARVYFSASYYIDGWYRTMDFYYVITVISSTVYVTRIDLSSYEENMTVGSTKRLYAYVYPTNATNTSVYWESGNSSIVSVSSNGLVTAKSSGTTYIYCTAKDGSGVYNSCKVIVGLPDGIRINSTNFPDANFRNYLLNTGYGSDGILTDAEIAGVTSINVSSKSIQSLKGIEYFTALTSLYCGGNQLTSLDVSKNTALTTLWCISNQLTSLDVSKNTKLTELTCRENQLTSLNVSGCTALTRLGCNNNQLTSLDVSKNTALRYLDCNRNQLTSLDVSKNTALTELNCYTNQLTSLDVSKNTELIDLSCEVNQLTSLDVSKNTKLTELYCYRNQLTSLDVSKNTALKNLYCLSNQLTSLDVSKNTALKYLYCYNNQLTSLDVSNTVLVKLYCYQNQIKGDAMDALVASLPNEGSGTMRVIYNENEQNVMTTTQVAAAKAKGWIPYYTEDGTNWKEYAGVAPSTGVNNVEASDADDSAPWYTINGVKLTEKPTAPGIYIHGGKKVVVK
jgi:Leucine-rich repeat (LRR) protein